MCSVGFQITVVELMNGDRRDTVSGYETPIKDIKDMARGILKSFFGPSMKLTLSVSWSFVPS